jgi:CubicO group peptidase (beta-lactamase class C family)
MSTGKPGSYSVNAGNPYGCGAMAIAGTIKLRPDVSLFPVGCDTLCWTDTLRFPLPSPSPGTYNITWYDDDGTAITNVGNGYMLPLSKLQPGMHHLYATVSFAGGCADTTGIFDLYVKDCTLLPVCDNCTGLVESITVEKNNTLTGSGNFQLNSSSLTITILKPVKEVRISLADLKYYWKDTACNNCKVQMIERGCLFPATTGQNLGTLLLDNVSNVPPGVANNKCPDELVWKNGTALQPGTYTIPLQLSLPKPAKDKCVLVLDKLCFHVTVIDTTCKSCDKLVCAATNTDNNNCKCNAANVWTSLYLLPKKPGIPKPRSLILCNNTLTGYDVNTAYVLSGVFHCQGNCVSTKNEITIFNQVNQIIYTHVATALNETIVFPAFGMYSVTLSAWCGTKKCVCSFKIFVAPEPKEPPVIITTGGGTNPNGNPNGNPLPGSIDSVLAGIIPKDFNGQILVSRNDSTIYEKNISYKDSVNSHTAFDLASVTKTFTSMAILKLMDEGKLSLDDVVVKYLPEFPVPEITIKMLLSHRSGLEDYLKFMDESDWDKTKNLTNKDLLQFIVANKSKVLINAPGKVFDYSNTNFALLSLIIEKVSGRLYKDYLSATFFTPLQMNDTYILDAGNFARATKSYYKNGKTYALRYLDLVNGDKCVYSTVQDLKKWDKGLRSGKLFKKSTLDMAYAPTGPLSPFVSNYALGWKKIVTTNGLEMIYHTGWWAGCRSLLIRLPKDNTMIAILSNNNFTNIADIRKLCDLFGDYQQSNKKIANF